LSSNDHDDEPANLHFHGMYVSPSGYVDKAFREVATGETANYVVYVPANHQPGMFWYHPHLHHFSYEQVSNGMSGLIIVNGPENLLPGSLQHFNQRTFAMKDFEIDKVPEWLGSAQSMVESIHIQALHLVRHNSGI
jgi:suppressor of ftsI